MAFYEIIGTSEAIPAYGSADTLAEAKAIRDEFASSGEYRMVIIRQYRKNKWGHETYRILHTLTIRREP